MDPDRVAPTNAWAQCEVEWIGRGRYMAAERECRSSRAMAILPARVMPGRMFGLCERKFSGCGSGRGPMGCG